jgi:hypothetical protein
MQCVYSVIPHSSQHSIRRRGVQIKFIMTIAIAVIMWFVDCLRLDVNNLQQERVMDCYEGRTQTSNTRLRPMTLCIVDNMEQKRRRHVPWPLRTVRPIYRTGVPLPSRCCILYIFSTNINTEYFKHAAYSPFFPSNCRLFHNATFFGSCIIHTLHTGRAKI